MDDPALLSKLYPSSFLDAFLDTKVRPDGRGLQKCRKTNVVRGILRKHTAGSALVKVGATKVLAGVQLQVGQPPQDAPTKGELAVEVHLPALCHPRYSSIQAQNDESKALEKFIQTLIVGCQMFNRESLCIVEGRHVWRLCLDIVCLSREGNLTDAAILAAIVALSDVILPATTISKDDKVLLTQGEGTPLRIDRQVVPITLGIYGDEVVADLSLLEEERISDLVTVVTDQERQVCAFMKPGGPPMPSRLVNTCLEISRKRWSEMYKLLWDDSIAK